MVLGCFQYYSLRCSTSAKGHAMKKAQVMKNRTGFAGIFALLFSLAFMPSSGGSQDLAQDPSTTQAQTKNGVVYVCACLRTKSCFCMTEAKTEGPCACGTEGGPPLKEVSSDSDWAKQNREALSK
jgi:hypothetical protein